MLLGRSAQESLYSLIDRHSAFYRATQRAEAVTCGNAGNGTANKATLPVCDPVAWVAQESLYSLIDRRSAFYRATRRAEHVTSGATGGGTANGETSSAAGSDQQTQPQPLLTPPNILTLLRVALVPVLVITWYQPGALPVQMAFTTSYVRG